MHSLPRFETTRQERLQVVDHYTQMLERLFFAPLGTHQNNDCDPRQLTVSLLGILGNSESPTYRHWSLWFMANWSLAQCQRERSSGQNSKVEVQNLVQMLLNTQQLFVQLLPALADKDNKAQAVFVVQHLRLIKLAKLVMQDNDPDCDYLDPDDICVSR